MIQITATLDGKANLTKFVHNLKTNIRRSQSKLAHDVTEVAWNRARVNAPVWRGDLKSKIVAKFMKKRGEVFIGGGWLDQSIAMANEFGVKPHIVPREGLIDEWATEKGYTNPDFVIIGGAGTHLGKQNKFFTPAFKQTERALPMIMAEVIRQNLMKTRG